MTAISHHRSASDTWRQSTTWADAVLRGVYDITLSEARRQRARAFDASNAEAVTLWSRVIVRILVGSGDLAWGLTASPAHESHGNEAAE